MTVLKISLNSSLSFNKISSIIARTLLFSMPTNVPIFLKFLQNYTYFSKPQNSDDFSSFKYWVFKTIYVIFVCSRFDSNKNHTQFNFHSKSPNIAIHGKKREANQENLKNKTSSDT
jgi:hypothetical protein